MDTLKILAVDDEEKVLTIIKTFCKNYDITTEQSPFKASERIEQEKFDIFIIDYQMPQINGIELLEQLKEIYDKKKYNYVSIFCTAYGTLHLFKDSFVAGVFDFFLEKPFEDNDFKNVFNIAVEKLNKITGNQF